MVSRHSKVVCKLIVTWLLLVAATCVAADADGSVPVSSAVQVTAVELPGRLSDVAFIAFGGLAADRPDGPIALRLGWEAVNQGWITTWSLKLSSPTGLLSRPDLVLTSVWPKAGHTYTARFDLVPELRAVGITVEDATANEEIFSGLVHLSGGELFFLTPRAAWPERDGGTGTVWADDVTVPGASAVLRGLPLSFQQQPPTFGVYSQESNDSRSSFTLEDSGIIRFAWPSAYVGGEVEIWLEAAQGQTVLLGRYPWSERVVEVWVDWSRMGPGEHKVGVDYVLGPLRERLVERNILVYAGTINVHIASLRMPGTYSVTDPGIDWTFHDSDAIVGTLRIERSASSDVSLQVEVWPLKDGRLSEAGAEPLAVIPLDLPASDRSNVRFTWTPPRTERQVRLVISSEAPGIAVEGQTTINLRRTPVEWAVPGGLRTRTIATLPTVPGVEHYTIYQATPDWGTFSHHAQIFYYDGVFYASWSNHATDEDAPGQWISYSLSRNGRDWTPVRVLFPSNDSHGRSGEDGRYMTAQRHSYQTGFVVVDGAVYAIGSVIEWDGGRRSKSGELARRINPDGELGPIFWLNTNPPRPKAGFPDFPSAADPEYRELAAKIIAKANPITWGGYALRAVDGRGIVELTSYVRPDGTGVLLGRDAENSGFMYAALGNPATRTWEPLVRVNIPDSPSLADTGVLPDGRIYLIHNPARARDPLVISLSKDGIRFDQAWIIRAGAPPLQYAGNWKTRGYQYPSSVVVDDSLWVIYSDGKENIHVSRLPLAGLGD